MEQRRRDRLLAYLLAHLLGNYLVPILTPDQQKPASVLATPLSYPQVRDEMGPPVLPPTKATFGRCEKAVQVIPTHLGGYPKPQILKPNAKLHSQNT